MLLPLLLVLQLALILLLALDLDLLVLVVMNKVVVDRLLLPLRVLSLQPLVLKKLLAWMLLFL